MAMNDAASTPRHSPAGGAAAVAPQTPPPASASAVDRAPPPPPDPSQPHQPGAGGSAITRRRRRGGGGCGGASSRRGTRVLLLASAAAVAFSFALFNVFNSLRHDDAAMHQLMTDPPADGYRPWSGGAAGGRGGEGGGPASGSTRRNGGSGGDGAATTAEVGIRDTNTMRGSPKMPRPGGDGGPAAIAKAATTAKDDTAAAPFPPVDEESSDEAAAAGNNHTVAKREEGRSPNAPPDVNATTATGTGGRAAANATTIAYAISMTHCPDNANPNSPNRLLDGAAVLRHSVHLNSIRNNANPPAGSSPSSYDYRMYAIVHPAAANCTVATQAASPSSAATVVSVDEALSRLGYTVLVRDTPVNVSQIRGEFLRTHIGHSPGCCGEKELIKLHSYTLVEHPVVVHLDVDAFLLHPLDELFDAMIHGPSDNSSHSVNTSTTNGTTSDTNGSSNAEIATMYPDEPLPPRIDAFFTRDYSMVNPGHLYPGVQGGFLVLRPSLETYERYRRIILEGDFQSGRGWGGKYGGYYGAQTIQGVVSYYYDGIEGGNTSVELNSCVYDNMAHNPRYKPKGGESRGQCMAPKRRGGRTGGGGPVAPIPGGGEEAAVDDDRCEDCREVDGSSIRVFHFTFCQKPWKCAGMNERLLLCRRMNRRWFAVRRDLDVYFNMSGSGGVGMVAVNDEGDEGDDDFYGYCGSPPSAVGRRYVGIRLPPASPAAAAATS